MARSPAPGGLLIMRYAGRTHPGRRGGQNEDSIGWDEVRQLWFVADGMGGHASGEVASNIVKQTLLEPDEPSLLEAVHKAHEAIAKAAALANSNMGSTVVALRLQAREGEIVWVGDSRGYLWRDEALQPVTRDHSFLELLREQENLTDEQLRGHPHKNLVTQTLGLATPEPSVSKIALRNRDWFLLCSDGLNDELEDREMAAILQAHAAPDAAADALIAAALAKGGRDNVSAVIVEYTGPDGVSSPRPLPKTVMLWLPVIAGILAALLAAGLWWWFRARN